MRENAFTSLWQSSVSFSDRFENINKIGTCLALTTTNGLEAKTKARELETECYDSATSASDYNDRIVTIIQQLEDGHPTADHADEGEIMNEASDAPTAPVVTIGKYAHAKHHGDGVFSTVYRARAAVENNVPPNYKTGPTRLVALKVTTTSLMVEPHDSEREARILSTCSHPHIMSLIESFWQAGGRFVLVFPFLKYDLATLIQTRRMKDKQIVSHLRDLFSGLSYLHSHGIIHRDVKPSNILMDTSDGPAYLADFGIAWSANDCASEPAHDKITDVGTTCYRPPELLFGNTAYNETLDLWAAGCVVAECFSKPYKTLFDAGDVGSELALIQSIFMTLGTPTTEVWPEAAGFRDWGKMAFREYPAKLWSELLPSTSDDARDLVSKLVRYESGTRLLAKEALQRPLLMLEDSDREEKGVGSDYSNQASQYI